MNFKYYKTAALIPFVVVLTIISNITSKGIISLLESSTTAKQINENIHIFSTLSLITFMILFINFVGWKWRLFKWLINIPNLNGRYKGELTSSFEEQAGIMKKRNFVVEIKQTASSIKLFTYSGSSETKIQSSSSFSATEEIIEEPNGLFTVFYIYNNEANVLQSKSANPEHKQLLHNHSGAMKFKYFPDIRQLEGEYFNHRQNIGTVVVKYEQKKLLGRLIP